MLSNHQEELNRAVKWRPNEKCAVLKISLSGSYAYGTNHADSDLDVRGVFMWPKKKFLLLGTPADELTTSELTDFKLFEVKKFIHLCTRGNPHQLELLFSEIIGNCASYYLFEQYIEKDRIALLGKQAIRDAYLGFAKSERYQLMKQEDSKRRNKRWRHVFRLLYQGMQLLESGDMTVRLPDSVIRAYNDISNGVWSDEYLMQMSDEQINQFEKRYEESHLPQNANMDKANEMLYNIRQYFE
jgi:predicted nucleotidyltransferase